MKKAISSDLEGALRYNSPSFGLSDITELIAEITGENDGYGWWWILKIKGRGYLLFSGGCDYTGWDCGSGITEVGFFKTKLQAAKAAPIEEEYYKDRKIRAELINQVKTGHTFSLEIVQ